MVIIRRLASLFILLVILLPLQSHANPSVQETDSNCLIRFAWDDWPPYQYLDSHGHIVGSQIEFLREIMGELGCELELVELDFSDVLAGIKAGDIHMTGNIAPTAARAKYGFFSIPYSSDYFVLFTTPKIAKEKSQLNMQQLLNQGLRVGVSVDYFYGESFSALTSQAKYAEQLVSKIDTYEFYDDLQQNQLDGFLDNAFIGAYHIRSTKLQGKIVRHPSVGYSQPVVFMYSKVSVKSDLVKRIDQIITRMQKSPDYERLWHFHLD